MFSDNASCRLHLCDYVCQVADADSTCNGILWQRVGAHVLNVCDFKHSTLSGLIWENIHNDQHVMMLDAIPSITINCPSMSSSPFTQEVSLSTISEVQDLSSYELFAGSSVLTGEFSLTLKECISQFGWDICLTIVDSWAKCFKT